MKVRTCTSPLVMEAVSRSGNHGATTAPRSNARSMASVEPTYHELPGSNSSAKDIVASNSYMPGRGDEIRP